MIKNGAYTQITRTRGTHSERGELNSLPSVDPSAQAHEVETVVNCMSEMAGISCILHPQINLIPTSALLEEPEEVFASFGSVWGDVLTVYSQREHNTKSEPLNKLGHD